MHLSIIIPIYNTPVKVLQETLNSVQNANIVHPYEVLLINDGSTDTSLLAFLENYTEPRAHITHTENRGVSHARNIGMKLTKGKYVLFLDSDDILTSEINPAIQFLNLNPSYDLVYSDTVYFGDSDFYYKKGEFSLFRLLYIHNFLNITTLFRHEIAEKFSFSEDMSYAEDYDFWCRIAKAGHAFKYLPKPIFHYRRALNGNSLSQIKLLEKEAANKKVKNSHSPHDEITLESVNQYFLNEVAGNKTNFIKLSLIIFSPWLFRFLLKKKVFKNDIVIG